MSPLSDFLVVWQRVGGVRRVVGLPWPSEPSTVWAASSCLGLVGLWCGDRWASSAAVTSSFEGVCVSVDCCKTPEFCDGACCWKGRFWLTNFGLEFLASCSMSMPWGLGLPVSRRGGLILFFWVFRGVHYPFGSCIFLYGARGCVVAD
ncbi:MATE efflux family protein [Striga asiatica]|uniref:MATE efflux family protein n=1 Tax=Striga asiatica TaxID=4170 RepID=A0A5A7QFT1_STRAF|nr:MATE efflux family protein [Striga asiatica]